MTTPKKHKRLSSSEWAEAVALWESGAVTLDELSGKFEITTRAFQLHFEKRNIKKGSKAEEVATAIRSEVFAATIGDSENILELAKEARQTSFNNAKMIEGMIMGQLAAAQKSPEIAFRAASSMKTLSLAAQALERLHDIKWKALGLDRQSVVDTELPEIVFRDLSKEELARMQTGQEEEGDEFEQGDRTRVTEEREETEFEVGMEREEVEVVMECEGGLEIDQSPITSGDKVTLRTRRRYS